MKFMEQKPCHTNTEEQKQPPERLTTPPKALSNVRIGDEMFNDMTLRAPCTAVNRLTSSPLLRGGNQTPERHCSEKKKVSRRLQSTAGTSALVTGRVCLCLRSAAQLGEAEKDGVWARRQITQTRRRKVQQRGRGNLNEASRGEGKENNEKKEKGKVEEC